MTIDPEVREYLIELCHVWNREAELLQKLDELGYGDPEKLSNVVQQVKADARSNLPTLS